MQRGERLVRALELKRLEPGVDHVAAWNGLTGADRPAPDGKYRIRVGPAGGASGNAGTVFLRGHRYPLLGPHGLRGAVGEFRAPRNGGRWHHGFDVLARCGTPLVVVRGGTVIRNAYDGALDGHYMIIRGRKENLTYRYSHLPSRSRLEVGDRVRTGDRVGVVGKSGNAASVGCHLHFEVKRGGRFIDPAPLLRAWDAYS
ncbi:MAG: peptidoglycan DD-metalloendopeptidase family protein [Solirubrobacterales bacterium]